MKFSPHSLNTFAAVSENGGLQLWDIRRQDKYYMQYAAHTEPIFSCDWHPDHQWIATGSRDKSIKVQKCTNYTTPPIISSLNNHCINIGLGHNNRQTNA